MFSKLKMKDKAFSLIEVMVSLFIISVVIMTCVLKYDFKTDVASRKEINTLVSDLKSARSVAMNSGRSIQFRFDTNSYYFYDSNKMKNLFERELKSGKLHLNKDGENTIDFEISGQIYPSHLQQRIFRLFITKPKPKTKHTG